MSQTAKNLVDDTQCVNKGHIYQQRQFFFILVGYFSRVILWHF